MNKPKTVHLPALIAGSLSLLMLIGTTSCNNAGNQQTTSQTEKTDTTTHAAKTAASDGNQLTLPTLNALFFEDNFENELKSKVKLTDQQVQQLKDTAANSVANLNEENGNESFREATKFAQQKITEILGQEKADELLNFINERYANGNSSALPVQPNTVPSDTRIVVNAPAFRMDVFQDGKLLKTYKVGIGYPEFPLPTGMRKAERIIFNPTWTPPDEPWVKGKVAAGKKVAAGSKLNPLGPIKIPIGLPSLIHGGKAVAKLGNFASHGCVGLTNAQVQDFTALLTQIDGMPIPADSILGYEKSKTKTKTVKLEKSVMVELRYETIVAENGVLHIYRDVYEHGTNTLENAKRVLSVYGIKYESLSSEEKQNLDNALSEMNLDAKGNAIAGSNAATNDSATSQNNRDTDVASRKERAKKGKVTRSVVGKKVIDVPLAALQNKGYPAPVNYDAGAITAAK